MVTVDAALDVSVSVGQLKPADAPDDESDPVSLVVSEIVNQLGRGHDNCKQRFENVRC
jgi:hypothetical protein